MMDITEKLTVFLITTSNDPNFSDCIQALKNQSVKFKLDIIKDYHPLSRAFQEMLNRCKTDFFIECDDDMILNSNAVKIMYDAMASSGGSDVFKCFQLLDVHLNFKLWGVKIYKSDIFKKYSYNLQHPSAEMEQLSRIKKDGYAVDKSGVNIMAGCVGKHSPHWEKNTIFERYYNLMEKFKIYRYAWLEKLPKMLFDTFKKSPTDLNLYAVAGALASINSDKIMKEEKDSRKMRIECKKLEAFMEEPNQATIYITDKCNFKCSWCFRQHHQMEQSPDVTAKLTDYLLSKFPSIKGVCICGYGDPLLSPDLIPVLNTLKYQNKFVGIITNGSLLSEKLPLLLGKYNPDYISVSLNAHCKEEHQKITKVDMWDKVLEGIKSAAKSKIPCFVSSVVTTENLAFVPQLLKLVKSLGVGTVHLHNLLPHFEDAKNEDFWKLVLTKEHEHHINKIKQLPDADIVKKYPTLIDKNGGNQTCLFPWKMMAMNGNGSISICNSVLPCHSKHGNIKDYVVWNSEYCQKFRDNFVNRKHNMCLQCFRNWTWI